jgi:hypothetical protein
MAASIAALTAGGGGLQSTSDASGNLNLVSGTTTIVAMTSAGIAVTGTLTASGAVTLTTVLPVASGGTGVATSTGSGANVLGTSPTLATPTFDSAQLATVVGTAPLYMARAWVNFNGTGTVAINASANVSSITDNQTGDYSVNFTTAMSDANYAAHVSMQPIAVWGETGNLHTLSSGVLRVATFNSATSVLIDVNIITATVFR